MQHTICETTGNIFIAGLPKNYDKKDLISLLSPYGTVVSAKIMIDLATASSKGIGFARITPASAALAAVVGLNDLEINRCKLNVKITDSVESFGEESEWIFLRGIKISAGKKCVYELLSKYGRVEQIKIKNCKSKKRPRGYLVKFSDKENSTRALLDLNNTFYKDEKYPMYIQFVADPEKWWEISQSPKKIPYSSSSSSSTSPSKEDTFDSDSQASNGSSSCKNDYDEDDTSTSWKMFVDDDF